MYALIDDQQLLLGPISFNYRMFNDELEELELDFRVNSSSYQEVPISITETVKILPARYDDPEYDSRFEYLTNITHTITETEVVFNHEKVQKSLEQVKEEYKKLVAPERWNKENTYTSVTVINNTITVSTSRENRLSLVSKLLSSEGPYNFKFDDGTWVDITKTDLQSILAQIDTVVQAAFDWELSKLSEIDACQSGEEVYLVEITPPLPIN